MNIRQVGVLRIAMVTMTRVHFYSELHGRSHVTFK